MYCTIYRLGFRMVWSLGTRRDFHTILQRLLAPPVLVIVAVIRCHHDNLMETTGNGKRKVWIEEEFQASVRGDSSSGVSVIWDGKVTPDGSDPVITDGVVKFSVVAEERAIHGE